MQTIGFSSSSTSFSDSEEECRQRIIICAALVVASVAEASHTPVVPMRGGSRPGKAKNCGNGIAQGAEQVRREGLLESDGYLLQNQDALAKLGASTDQIVVCALRQLA
jgi:hypothetical protein